MPVVPASASAVSITGGFCDVPASSPYASAIVWAVKENIISGKSAGIFAPNEEYTNEQILTFLWRDSRASGGVLGTQFRRCARRGSYAGTVAWAVEQGTTSGTGNGAFSPAKTCTQGQSAAFLYRAYA